MVANRQANVKRWFMEMPASHVHAVFSAAALNFHTLSRMLGQSYVGTLSLPGLQGCRFSSDLTRRLPELIAPPLLTRAANTLNGCLLGLSHCLAHSGALS